MHIQRDDGKWLVGPGATEVSDKRGAPWASLSAAMSAIARYRLSVATFCGRTATEGFTIFHA